MQTSACGGFREEQADDAGKEDDFLRVRVRFDFIFCCFGSCVKVVWWLDD